MAIRACTLHDIPAVVALFGRVYPEHRWHSRTECEAYFRETLFETPWHEFDLPSLVAEEAGAIVGFQAIVPRPMSFRGRPLRAAVSSQFMVDPARRNSLLAFELLKACLAGPQDLTFADGSNDGSRRLAAGMGMHVPLLYSMHWTRPLRPVRYAMALLGERGALPAPALAAARPFAALADAFAGRLRPNRFYREPCEFVEGALDARTMLAHLPEMLRGVALRPEYDARSLAWLLGQAARKRRHGRLRARCVRDLDGRVLGWYLYYLRREAAGEVLQIAARDGAYDVVLRRMLADAWRNGALALRGRVDPRYVHELSMRHCWSRREGTWTVAHSNDPEIMAAIHRGDAAISRLEGEWWMRYQGEGGSGKSEVDESSSHAFLSRHTSSAA